jgi:FKBP-type peptidyl-prolyl cis-trans isomerase FklB
MSKELKKPETFEQRVSYGFGWQFGRQLQKNRFEGMDVEACVQALRQCFAGEPSMLSENELNEAYDAVKEKRKEVEAQRTQGYKDLCEKFLAENGNREGVRVTDSGLQIEVLEDADGPVPSLEQKVVVHYHGSFIDGQVFDSSVTRNEPAEFGVKDVISGWTEALMQMPKGAKWRVVVPADLAYGEAGMPPAIPANSALVFELHLIDILDQQ